MRVALFGLGYVGSVTAACLAKAGHEVVGVDINAEKVTMLNAARSPVVEPGLAELLATVVGGGRLRATTSSEEAVAASDVSLICVGTPGRPNGQLDVDTVVRLDRAFHPRFFVPLGLKAWMGDLGITNVVELDWWESQAFRGLTFTCTPAQHSSGRGLRDQNLRLWSSWVVTGGGKRFFFAGDTGYTKALGEIGMRLGPFDLAAIPIGGYSAWEKGHPNHVNPEEALQVLEDVGGRLFVPIHFGTFDMNREPFAEPPARLMKAAVAAGIEEHVALLSPGQSIHW